ncbi:tRNA(fMet)-specific endonuclease VapC [Wielerella bovis]|uniref:type II toxin-antitoxin system tRNA(fMet)-specific endonuclease VapC n=1 Tax=Wielerella bovis TaxID=2917790 RepID=UPI0020191BE3|nr:tRNA(fMet)-specific endonuclease VapC [Wielerella bovis]ULJ63136.1 tRNA(fMet)-specific endonuclease VapC [Wielerella bovis]
MIKYFLDTHICIYAMKHKPLSVREKFNAYQGQMAISSVVLMELAYGAECSQSPQKAHFALQAFVEGLQIVDFNSSAAYHTAQIRAHLRKVGTPIGSYDTMIAGHARSMGLILVSNNLKEFERVEGLRLENWA